MKFIVVSADNVGIEIPVSKLYDSREKAGEFLKRCYEELCDCFGEDKIETKYFGENDFYEVKLVNGELHYAQVRETVVDNSESEDKVRKILTVRKLADAYARMIDAETSFNRNIPNCDFAIIDELNESEDLEDVAFNAAGWFGLRVVDTGFDSSDLNIVTDYYGGGDAQLTSVYDGEENDTVVEELTKNIFATLECTEKGHEDMKLIVEFEIEEV